MLAPPPLFGAYSGLVGRLGTPGLFAPNCGTRNWNCGSQLPRSMTHWTAQGWKQPPQRPPSLLSAPESISVSMATDPAKLERTAKRLYVPFPGNAKTLRDSSVVVDTITSFMLTHGAQNAHRAKAAVDSKVTMRCITS